MVARLTKSSRREKRARVWRGRYGGMVIFSHSTLGSRPALHAMQKDGNAAVSGLLLRGMAPSGFVCW